MVLLRAENTTLQEANHILSRRRCTKKRRLQERGSLIIREAQDLQTCTNPRSQLQVVLEQSSDRTSLSVTPRRRCRLCSKASHNI